MKVDDARGLEIGDRLLWKPDGVHGTVTDKGYAGVTITREDEKVGIFTFTPECPWQSIEFWEEL
jgi:hypothetical protein